MRRRPLSWRGRRTGASVVFALLVAAGTLLSPNASVAAPPPYKFTVLPLSDLVGVASRIVTDGTRVFWFDAAGALHARGLYDGFETILVDGPARRMELALANGLLVWSETGANGSAIRALWLANTELVEIAGGPGERNSPAISGNTVVWRDNRSGNWDVYRYDVETRQASPLVTEGSNQGLVAITGDNVIWEDHRSGSWSLRGYNLVTRNEYEIVGGSDDYLQPVAMDGAVAYIRRSPSGGFGTLLVRELATGAEQVVADGRPVTTVALSGTAVVWEDWRDGLPNIRGFDRASNQEFVISRSEQARRPAVAGNLVVWVSKSQFASRVAAVRLEQPLPTDRVDPPTVPDASVRYFEATGHTLAEPFKTFWLQHEGLANFGYPISEPFDERSDTGANRRVQYFERARLEVDPADATSVSVGRLGAEALRGRTFPPVEPFDSTADRAYFPVTGHSVGGAFKSYWEAQGGVALFGYPLSEEVREGGLTVQYFERARFEFHPDAAAGEQVTLAQLGREALIARGWLPGRATPSKNR